GAEQARRKGARTDGGRAAFLRPLAGRGGAGSWRAVRTVAGSSGGAGGWPAAGGRQFLRRLREVLRGVDGPPVGALRDREAGQAALPRQVRERGALVVAALRQQVGEPGGEDVDARVDLERRRRGLDEVRDVAEAVRL